MFILDDIQRTAGRRSEILDHVRIDHRRFDVGVAEVILDLPDVDAIEQEMCGEAVTQRILTLLMNHPQPSAAAEACRWADRV